MDVITSSVFCEVGIQYKNTSQLKLEVGVSEGRSAKDTLSNTIKFDNTLRKEYNSIFFPVSILFTGDILTKRCQINQFVNQYQTQQYIYYVTISYMFRPDHDLAVHKN